MLTRRIIPVLLHNGRQLVKGQKFDSWRPVGSPLQAMEINNRRGVDELILLDVSATREGRHPDCEFTRRMADEFNCPLTVGGGIKTLDDVKQLLRSGADKVVIGSQYNLIPLIECEFGTQAVVASVDYRGDTAYCKSGTESWDVDPLRWAEHAEDLGCGEIMLNCIDRDGTQMGYDTLMLDKVAHSVMVPVIACGGCSGYEDMAQAFTVGASAVAVGALFQFTECTPRGAARYLASKGFHVRV